MDESALIDAVLRLRTTDQLETAAQVHEALIKEGHDVTISQVKKASSKAMKKASANGEKAAEPLQAATKEEAKRGVGAVSKKEEKAAKAAVAAMKSAEAHMMMTCRKLRMALGEDEYAAAIATSDRGERFIQQVTTRALEAKLRAEEANTIHERVEADLAVLEWALLAVKAKTLTLPPEALETAATQVERLKGVRGATTIEAVQDCFVLPEPDGPPPPPSGVEYAQKDPLHTVSASASLDRAVARSGALAVGADELDID
jgi:hypothetical protein